MILYFIYFFIGGCYDTAKRNKGKQRLTIGGVSARFKKLCEVYKVFGYGFTTDHLFTDQEIVDLYNHESYGNHLRPKNGYSLGKKWMDVTISMWIEDINSGLLRRSDLYDDERFPHWWLDSVLRNV